MNTIAFKKRVSSAASLLALTAGFSFASQASLAQDEAAESSGRDTIIVTAQFREQNLQDTPLAITALNADMIDARGYTDLSDVGQTAPNVTLRPAAAPYGPAVVAYIRGVGQRDSTFALEPGVGIYIDDVYFPTLHGSLIELIDLDRVEILRGPQGTLAGQNSIGGAIRLYSKKPAGEGQGFAQLTYGSYNRLELRAAQDFSIIEDELFVRFSGTGARSDGFIKRYDYACTHPGSNIPSVLTTADDCQIGTEGGKSYLAGRVAVRWEPTDRISADIVADITEDDSEVGPSTLLFVGQGSDPGTIVAGSGGAPAYFLNGEPYGTAMGSPYIAYSPYGNFALDPFSDSPYISYENYTDVDPRDGSAPWQAPLQASNDSWGISANIQVDLTDWLNVISITGYREYDGTYSSGDGSPFTPTAVSNRVFNEQFSQEIRFNANFNDVLNLTVGGFYFDKESRNASRVTLVPFNFTEVNVIPAKTKAVFANADLAVTDRLNIIGGIRYTDQEKTFEYGRFGILGSDAALNGSANPILMTPGADGAVPWQLAGINDLVGEFKGDRVDYRAVVQYRWIDGLMTYAQFSTGFKGGGINPRPFFPAQALPHDPETLNAYEIGFKSSFMDNRVTLNAAGFVNKYDDILVTTAFCPLPGAPPSPCALPLNAGEATVKGFEAELALRPVDGLMIDASLAHLDFEYDSISDAAANSGIGLEDNGQYIQDIQWSIGAQYEFFVAGFGTLTPRVDVNFEDDYHRNANNVDAATGAEDIFGHIGSRTLVNARLTYTDPSEAWRISLEAKNLTDELYYTDIFDNRGSTNSIQGRPGMPRTFAVTLRRNF
ncbi:TonB-dependent receptor [Hyphococcus luteus]|uniref:TonB-dependent receptor n=1 Tax=Hyphococcus luteus TaxID=2058213 RepID=A0A2S7K506_9PROT|nr:TonB-dependent receptor [Marinicaulis flavus]PQA87597.1 TonB-dependent receptor [Marinicaulis flavus]